MKKITLILMSLFLTLGAVAQDYSVPKGVTYVNNYLTSINTTDADENITYTASSHPGSAHNILSGKVVVKAGNSFTLNLVAKSLGSGSYYTVREDIRYCHASIFTDFDQDKDFGSAAFKIGNKPPTNNVYGNYDLVMNISRTITVPANAPAGVSRVRVIYTNAWGDWPLANTTGLDKGIAYDIEVEVVSDGGIVEPEPDEPTQTFVDGGLYRIQSKGMDFSKDLFNTQTSTGAYLSSTKGQKTGGEISIETKSMGDAGCVWKFEGNDEAGYTIKNMNNGYYISKNKKSFEGFGDLICFTEDIDEAGRFEILKKGSVYTIRETSKYFYLYANNGGLRTITYDPEDSKDYWLISKAEKLTVALNPYNNPLDEDNNGYYASLYLPFATNLPLSQAVMVCGVEVNNSYATLNYSMTGDVPAYTGVILKSSGKTNCELNIVQETLTLDVSNQLSGTNVDMPLGDGDKSHYYVLGVDNVTGKIGLRNPSGSVGEIPANRAYLYSANSSVNALRFMVGEATSVENVAVENVNEPVFDLSGRRVLKTIKGGVYIQNGVKFIVK